MVKTRFDLSSDSVIGMCEMGKFSPGYHKLMFCGMGITGNNSMPLVLQEAEIAPGLDQNPDFKIRVHSYGVNNKSAVSPCFGDSGGPLYLVENNSGKVICLYGIIIGGVPLENTTAPCNDGHRIVLFRKVPGFKPLIEKTIQLF
ncbi:uncharacterized protein LOC142348826 [Convolutriloba macropyga]|uniref:uncharacterized protein LOC142348826 n=1 Tax=Convolutriloba macropyga TaxID=536237 RepID=UPI003F525C8C